MQNIEKSLGYQLEQNNGGAFLQKEELQRLNAKLLGKGEKAVSLAEVKSLTNKLKEQKKRLAALEQKLAGMSRQTMTKADLAKFRANSGEIPTSSFYPIQ